MNLGRVNIFAELLSICCLDFGWLGPLPNTGCSMLQLEAPADENCRRRKGGLSAWAIDSGGWVGSTRANSHQLADQPGASQLLTTLISRFCSRIHSLDFSEA